MPLLDLKYSASRLDLILMVVLIDESHNAEDGCFKPSPAGLSAIPNLCVG